MSAPDRHDQQRLARIIGCLADVSLSPCTDAPVEDWLPVAVQELLGGGNVIAYRPEQDGHGRWGLGARASTDGALFAEYDRLMRSGLEVPFLYDPLRPSADQRNVAVCMQDIHSHHPDETCVVEDVWPRIGMRSFDQLRLLVCEGPALIAWVGALREEPFRARERKLLGGLVVPLQRALGLRRRLLDGQVTAAGLASALEAIGAPAFIAASDGRIEHANEAGANLATTARQSVATAIRRAAAGENAAASAVARLRAPGLPERYLVVLPHGLEALDLRLHAAQREWSTTRLEDAVLRWLVVGDSNKEIALKIERSEVSVERRVTSLLRKSRCDSRARLVAAFWRRS